MRKIIIFIGLMFIGGCAYLGYLKDPFTDIPNFHQVNGNIYRGGQPKLLGLERLESLGIKTIVSLRGHNDTLLKEQKSASNLGMNFYNIPLSVYKRPDDEQVLTFLEIILDTKNQPIFIHCGSGRDRTGAMIALYRVVVQRWGPKEAYKEAKHLGFWPYYGKNELKIFIHQLKDKKLYFDKVKEVTDANNQ